MVNFLNIDVLMVGLWVQVGGFGGHALSLWGSGQVGKWKVEKCQVEYGWLADGIFHEIGHGTPQMRKMGVDTLEQHVDVGGGARTRRRRREGGGEEVVPSACESLEVLS